jgi:ornithine decarboxylase
MTTSSVRRVPTVDPSTPYLALDLDQVQSRYGELAAAIPAATIHYAVKANDHPAVLATIAALGGRFDVASPGEVSASVAAGVEAGHLLYSNPVKAPWHLEQAYAAGVRLFVADSLQEVAKIARYAPGSAVLARLQTSGKGADWPLTRKFGCHAGECVSILHEAAQRGLTPAGVTFHVGSQQRDPHAWDEPIASAAWIFNVARAVHLDPYLLDLGGGFPADLGLPCPDLATYGAAINAAVTTSFGTRRPELVVEPGRALVADAGVLVASVIGVVERDLRRWVFVDAGVYSGLAETIGESIRYHVDVIDGDDPFERGTDRGPYGPVVLAGPTCDSADIMYERHPIELPLALEVGDRLAIHAAGAYTTTYATRFNGFPQPAVRAHRSVRGTGLSDVA